MAPVLLIALTATSSLRQEDVRFWDESSYLERGLNLGFGSQPGWEWNPLYTDTYWLLHQFLPNTIDLYFAGRVTSAAVIVLAVWLSLRLFTGPLLAFSCGVVMASVPITYVWPGVSNPSAAFVVLALAVMWRWRNAPSLVAAAGLTWFAAASRPEFVWVAAVVTIVIAVYLLLELARRRLNPRNVVLLMLGLMTIPILLVVGYGNPIELGSRSWLAFEQHYEFRFATASDDPWQVDADIVGRDFPGATSIPAAIAANPSAVAVHMARNAITLPVSAGGHLMGLGGNSPQQNLIGIGAASLWMLGLAIAVIRPRAPRRQIVHALKATMRESPQLVRALLTAIVLGASVVSTLIIYPRPHYLGVLIAAALVISGIVISRFARPKLAYWVPSIAVLLVGAAALLFNIVALGTGGNAPQPNATALRIMNGTDTQWRLLTPERPIDIYLDQGEQVLEVTNEYQSFAELLEDQRINVVFDGILLRQASWSTLEDFQAFLDNPENFGFTPITEKSPFLRRR